MRIADLPREEAGFVPPTPDVDMNTGTSIDVGVDIDVGIDIDTDIDTCIDMYVDVDI